MPLRKMMIKKIKDCREDCFKMWRIVYGDDQALFMQVWTECYDNVLLEKQGIDKTKG